LAVYSTQLPVLPIPYGQGITSSVRTDSSGFTFPTIVQKASAVTSGTTTQLSVSFKSAVTKGNTLVAVWGMGNSNFTNITDNQGNVLTNANYSSSTLTIGISYEVVGLPPAGSSPIAIADNSTISSININSSVATSMAAEIYEVAGVWNVSTYAPLSDVSSVGVIIGTSITPPGFNVSVPGSLAFSGVTVGSAAQTITVSNNNNSVWNFDSGQLNPTSASGLFSFGSASAVYHKIGNTATANTMLTWNVASSEPLMSMAALFRPVPSSIGYSIVTGDVLNNVSDLGAPSVKIGGVFNTFPSTINSGNRGDIQINNKGMILTQISDGTTGVAVVPGGSLKTDLTTVAGNTVGTAASGIQKVGLTDGTGNAITSTSSALDVNLKTSSITLGVSGTVTANQGGSNWSQNIAQVNGSTVSTATTGVQKVGVVGNAGAIFDGATAASVPANALYTGLRGSTANPTAVSDGQTVGALADKLGKIIAVGSIRDMKVQQFTTITSSTSETTIVTAVASTFLDLYGLIITNSSATATTVIIKDSTAGTTRMEFVVPPGDTRGFMLPEGGAHSQATVNNNWTATCGTSVASIFITALCVKNI
jgi:hypothetical protein